MAYDMSFGVRVVCLLATYVLLSTQAKSFDRYEVIEVGPVDAQTQLTVVDALLAQCDDDKVILMGRYGVSARLRPVRLAVAPDRIEGVKANLLAHDILVKVVIGNLQRTLDANMQQNDEARQRELTDAAPTTTTAAPDVSHVARMSRPFACLLRLAKGRDWPRLVKLVRTDRTWRTWICSGKPPLRPTQQQATLRRPDVKTITDKPEPIPTPGRATTTTAQPNQSQQDQERPKQTVKPPTQPEYYMNTTEVVRWLTQAGDASNIAEAYSIGNSHEGRPTMGIKINGRNRTLPIVWVDAGMHAREWLSVSTAIYLTHRILFGKDTDAVYLRKNFRWYIVPNSNPDGYDYSWTENRLWRKTRVPHTAKCVGTDLNRNFAFNWGEVGASSNPCNPTYKGAGPFSDVESRNLRDAIWPIRADTKLLLNLHTYDQSWILPYTGLVNKTDDYDRMKAMADSAVASLKSVHGKVFRVGRLQDFFSYKASGTEMDWAKGVANITYTYVLELRPAMYADGGFTAPPENILPSGEEIFAALVTCCRSL